VPPPKRRRYTKAEKATVVIAAEMSTAAAAADATGVPESTIRYWLDNPKFAELRVKTREEAAAGFSVLMHMAQKRLQELIPDMEPRDLTILLGVSAEKAQLLGGGPTSRTETRALTDDFDDDEKKRLRDWIDALPSTADVPEGDPA
jgi:transposase-like protein